jgi:hypothetical protein
MPAQNNRKTVISRPTVSDKMDNIGKSGNKDSVKLVAIEDVQNIVNNAKQETEDIRIKLAKSITEVLHVPECLLATKGKFTKEVLDSLDVHQMLSLYNRIIEFERRITKNAK